MFNWLRFCVYVLIRDTDRTLINNDTISVLKSGYFLDLKSKRPNYWYTDMKEIYPRECSVWYDKTKGFIDWTTNKWMESDNLFIEATLIAEVLAHWWFTDQRLENNRTLLGFKCMLEQLIRYAINAYSIIITLLPDLFS